jgi:hypothetical protein
MTKLPPEAVERGGKVYNSHGELIEIYGGEWRVVINASRVGWWRFHGNYDRDGYCDNPARGY